MSAERSAAGIAKAPARVKPRLRGAFHEIGFSIALTVAVPVIATTEAGIGRALATIFATSLVCCFGASALYHGPPGRQPSDHVSHGSTTQASTC